MTKAWKKLDLEGGGLQSANLQLARRLKRRPLAHALWLAFPLGAHAWYLRSYARAAAYLALSLIAAGLYFAFHRLAALTPLIGSAALALTDLFWIERRLVALNKAIRMQVYLHQAPAAPSGFKGRYTDEDTLADYMRDKEKERAGHGGRDAAASTRAPSFAEQAALLREMARRRKHEKKKRGGDDA